MAHILIVDDSPEALRLMRTALAHEHEVRIADSADTGLELLKVAPPQALVVDLEMPGEDGVWLVERVRRDSKLRSLPVVMVSARPVRETVLRAANAGVQGVILKDGHFTARLAARLGELLRSAGPATPAGPAPSVVIGRSPVGEPSGGHDAAPARAEPAGAPIPRAPSEAGEISDQESMAASLLQLDPDGCNLNEAAASLRRLRPLVSRSQLLDQIQHASELRALGPSVRQVLSLTSSQSASLDAVARAVKQDQALALKVLRVANSPLYTRGERVESVSKAVARIGLAQIRSTVLSLGVIEQFASFSLAQRVKADWFWEHSLACGLLASKLSALRGAGPGECDAMFTAGLLHDVGRVIFAEHLGETYTQVLDTAQRLHLPLEAVESRLLMINHADATDRLLRLWRFSPELINPIALHHLSVGNIRRLAPRAIEPSATLALANRLAHALLLGSSGNDTLYPIEEFVSILGIDREALGRVCREAPEQVADLRLSMLSHAGSAGRDHAECLRATLGERVRALTVSLDPGRDATGLLLERLGAAATDGEPNVAVVRVAHTRERAGVLDALKSAEHAAGVRNLPVLVLGSGAGCLFAEGMLGHRAVRQMVLPARMSRIVEALNSLCGITSRTAPLDPAVAVRAA